MSKIRLFTVSMVTAVLVLFCLGGFHFTESAAIADEAGQAKVVIEPVPEQGDFKVKIWTDKKTYLVGETVTAYVRSEESGYLTIYDFPPQNQQPHLIFPNNYTGYDPSVQRIEADRTYQIPAPEHSFLYKVAPPAGEEMFVAIVTKEPRVAPQPESKEELFPTITKAPDEFAANLKVIVEPEKGRGLGYTTFNVKGAMEGGWQSQPYREETSGGVTKAWPIGFNPDDTRQVGDSYWLHDSNFQNWSAWKFKSTSSLNAANDVWLDFRLLATNSLQGGQGYETTVRVTLQALDAQGAVVREHRTRVKLNNPVRPKNPSYSYGTGWQTYGLLQVPTYLIKSLPYGGELLVKIERDPFASDNGYQPVVGANMNFLTLSYK